MSRLIYRMFCCCKFQCSSLLNDVDREDFVEEIAEEYDEIRTDHYDSLKVNYDTSVLWFSQGKLGQ